MQAEMAQYANLTVELNTAVTPEQVSAMGADVEERADGMAVTGGAPLHGATLQSFDDHRIAMSFLVAGLAAQGETTLEGCGNIGTSYPGFEETLSGLAQA